MDKWFTLSREDAILPGNFLEATLIALSGHSIASTEDFIVELATRIMLRYESRPAPKLLALDQVSLESTERTKHFYRRFFSGQGAPTQEFETWASETLAAWMEETFETPICVDCSSPHATDPTYDVITLAADGEDSTVLRLVQVKSTRDNLQWNCNEALTKFRRLEQGDYDAELLDRLNLLRERGKLPGHISPRELFYDPNRRYRVTALHGQDRKQITIMTTYEEKIPGDVLRRSARLVHISEWNSFWSSLAGTVYAHLA